MILRRVVTDEHSFDFTMIEDTHAVTITHLSSEDTFVMGLAEFYDMCRTFARLSDSPPENFW